MTLEDAILHARCKARKSGACGKEHEQLVMWLEELRALRSETDDLRRQLTQQRENKRREFDALRYEWYNGIL